MRKPTITNQRELRRAFWRDNPGLSRRKIVYKKWTADDPTEIKVYNCDTRSAFVDWLDSMSRDSVISQELAERATLE